MRTIHYPWQRMLLHTVCLCRRPRNSRFHLQGIARELPFKAKSERTVTRADTFLLVLSAVTAIATQSLIHQYTHPEPRSPEPLRRVHKSAGQLPLEMSHVGNELARPDEQAHAFRK